MPRGKGEPFLGTGRARGRVARAYRGVEMSARGAGKGRAGRAHRAHQAQEEIEDGVSCGRGRMRNLQGDPEKKKDLTDALG